jgi:hypothetical protein
VLAESCADLQTILFDDEEYVQRDPARITTFAHLISRGESSQMTEVALAERKSLVRASDILNYQFTSGMFRNFQCKLGFFYHHRLTGTGTTGSPKASMLSHV